MTGANPTHNLRRDLFLAVCQIPNVRRLRRLHLCDRMRPLLPRGSRQLVHHRARHTALRRDAAQHQPGLPGHRVLCRPAHRVGLLLQGQERRLARHRSVGVPGRVRPRRRAQRALFVGPAFSVL